MKYDVVIIGAGAAGLMAMKELLAAGYHVCLLEASVVAGGRIATIEESGFDQPAETGAEFVHGKLPLTLQLLNKANIEYIPVEGKMIAVEKGKWQKNEAHDKHWETCMRQLGKLKTDITIGQFLEQFFPGAKFNSLRSAVKRFSEGFDLGDITKASALAAQLEWSHEDETQYRIPGGYMQLINYLLTACIKQKGVIQYNARASMIEYNKESVVITTNDSRRFEAATLLITVSAGVLQSGELKFVPVLEANYVKAIHQLGFGSVIKILLQFKTRFWTKYAGDTGFLISDETIPTWWTQLPLENNLLTGWLGGPAATARSGDTEESLLQSALLSLAGIFSLSPDVLRQELVHHKINCWRNHPYIKGGYSYVTTDSAAAKKVLSHLAEGTVFFAGEALYRGKSQGTVEAALQSGRMAAKMIKDVFADKKFPLA
ncbi:MAG: NAD(P)/FAD-dependent oxidoreductase [Bacteroidota bacterium]